MGQIMGTVYQTGQAAHIEVEVVREDDVSTDIAVGGEMQKSARLDVKADVW